MQALAPDYVLNRTPYVAGRPIGINEHIKEWAKLASNENCLGASRLALLAAQESLSLAHFYPNSFRHELIKAITDFYKDYGLREKNIALGNGSSELIINLVRGLVFPHEAIITGWPAFITYRQAAEVHGVKEHAIPLNENLDYDLGKMLKKIGDEKAYPCKIVFIINPNNPTGAHIPGAELESFIKELPKDIVLVVDEAYSEYVIKENYYSTLNLALSRPKTIVLKTFSKAYGLAGLRLGYALGDEKVIDVLCKVRDHFNVNSVVQYAALAALKDQNHIKKSVSHNQLMLPILSKGLKNLGFTVKDSACNFVLAKKPSQIFDMVSMCDELFLRGVILRPMDSYGLRDYVRISVGTKREIGLLFKELSSLILGNSYENGDSD